LNVYQCQAHKLFAFISSEYIPKIPTEAVSATTRLKILMEEYQKTGHLKPMEGKTMS